MGSVGCFHSNIFFTFQGLFSRITFREPVFIGGPGNTTGLSDKLPINFGFKGCVRHIDINDHAYSFQLAPEGDSVNGLDVCKYQKILYGAKWDLYFIPDDKLR